MVSIDERAQLVRYYAKTLRGETHFELPFGLARVCNDQERADKCQELVEECLRILWQELKGRFEGVASGIV